MRMLAMAQKTAEDTVSDAKRDADRLLAFIENPELPQQDRGPQQPFQIAADGILQLAQ